MTSEYMNTDTHTKLVILCVLDGWGIAENTRYNAIANAKTPNWDYIVNNYPSAQILTSGMSVGLPNGQMGNSEVGHMVMGSGRVIEQDITRINKYIESGKFDSDVHVLSLVRKVKSTTNRVHIMGLISDGGVHSHIDHMKSSIKALSNHNVQSIIHIFLDGRDTCPNNAIKFINELQDFISAYYPLVSIGSIMGRYYPMDRDNRWERTKLAYDAIISANAEISYDIIRTIEYNYANNITDEFIKPYISSSYDGVHDGDGLMVINFRSDRVRQILSSFLDPEFSNFTREKVANFSYNLGMVNYSEKLDIFMEAIIKNIPIENSIGEILSKNNLAQMRIAETEKYPHVTYFFNCYKEDNFPLEERILLSSPNVATYDLQPEMSAYKLTEELIKVAKSAKYSFILINYANADMIGHTGNFEAAVKSVEVIDDCLGLIYDAIIDTNYVLIITADHGNIEEMFDEKSGNKHTSHTTNPVPFLLIGKAINKQNYIVHDGTLRDIAPTILSLLTIDIPDSMSGRSLIEEL